MSTIEIKVPDLPESVADGMVATWHKKVGDAIKRDEVIVEIETDKVVLEVPSFVDGVLTSIAQAEGASVVSAQVLGSIEEGAVAAEPVAAAVATDADDAFASPAVRRKINELGLDLAKIKGTGKGGKITLEDVDAFVAATTSSQKTEKSVAVIAPMGSREEKRVPMTRLRKRIAERLLEAKNSTAMLTTFNEVDMSEIMKLRKQYGERFEKGHDIRLGFMSFYVKAVVEALKRYPEVNASIDGDDIVYHNYFDISVAISTPRGLVTPVIRNAEGLSMAQIEKSIKQLAENGKNNKLTVDDLTGGNFTITNGGVFGSLLSTPIINPPQSAILGMHAIQKRVVVIDDKMEIRPMMYLALSYDHRIIDGRESVGFLVAIKELLEDPTRLLLEV